jgi:hypothetical protein
MTDARVEPVPADPATARVFLDRAERFLEDADHPSIAHESKQILYWQACISTLEALLLAAGRRVTPGAGGHMVRLAEADRVLAGNYGELFERLDLHRDIRHDVSYAAGVASELGTAELRTAAGELLEVVREYVTR